MRRLGLMWVIGIMAALMACAPDKVDLSGSPDSDSIGAEGDGDMDEKSGDWAVGDDEKVPSNDFYAPMIADPAYLSRYFSNDRKSRVVNFGESWSIDLAAGEETYVSAVFDALPGARVNVSLHVPGSRTVGLALYGPRGLNGLWGSAVAVAEPGNERLLMGEITLQSYGHYLLLAIVPRHTQDLTLEFSLGCRGRCGEPPCADLGCQAYCEAGFKLDANGCASADCECLKPNAKCYSDAECPTGYSCQSGICSSGQISGCKSDTDCKSGAYCKEGGCFFGDNPSGKTCAADSDCLTSQFCQNGVCAEKTTSPTDCQCQSEAYRPVCGTDGVVYGNSCEAKCKGAGVLGDSGLCTSATGCKLDSECPTSQICDLTTGTCKPAKDCSCDGSFSPVCGKDGKTYGNACELACAGTPLWHEGVCNTEESCTLICTADAAGNLGWFNTCKNEIAIAKSCTAGCKATCQNANSNLEGWYSACDGSLVLYADCSSSCGCSPTYDPVCGKDGKTYSNACEAACAKIDVAYRGVCDVKQTGCKSASECPSGQICTMPCSDPTNAACAGVCQTPPDANQCGKDLDCPPGEVCVPFAGTANNVGICQVPNEGECVVSGCFLESCASYSLAGSCQYSVMNDCLPKAKCERGADGICMWRDDTAGSYAACLSDVKTAPSCAKDADCTSGLLCLDGGCRKADCVCPTTDDSVCGTKTYASFCLALCAGESGVKSGACP